MVMLKLLRRPAKISIKQDIVRSLRRVAVRAKKIFYHFFCVNKDREGEDRH